jgi:putative membrane protein insertion efficiency factor
MPSAFAIALIRIYRVVLSPLLGQNCRFYPTCSVYTEESIRRHGAARGIWRGIARLARCHPFHPGGYDPVVPDVLDRTDAQGGQDAPTGRRRRRQAAA